MTPTEIEAALTLAREARARADAATPLPDTDHSITCGCAECGAVWARAKELHHNQTVSVRDVPRLAAAVEALAADRGRLVEALRLAYSCDRCGGVGLGERVNVEDDGSCRETDCPCREATRAALRAAGVDPDATTVTP